MSKHKCNLGLIVSLLFMVLLFTACNDDEKKVENDKALVKNFFEIYFAQSSFTKEEWQTISDSLDKEALTLAVSELANKIDIPSKIKKKWKNILTDKVITSLIANRMYPNFTLKDNFKMHYDIENIEKTDEENKYKVKISISKNDYKKEEYILFGIIDLEDKRIIDYIDIGSFQNLLKQ